jgi:hypothetical protein
MQMSLQYVPQENAVLLISLSSQMCYLKYHPQTDICRALVNLALPGAYVNTRQTSILCCYDIKGGTRLRSSNKALLCQKGVKTTIIVLCSSILFQAVMYFPISFLFSVHGNPLARALSTFNLFQNRHMEEVGGGGTAHGKCNSNWTNSCSKFLMPFIRINHHTATMAQ